MKNWDEYIKAKLSSDVWGFVLLDHYRKQRKSGSKEDPSSFLDRFLGSISSIDVDFFRFHRIYVCVATNLLGNDFTDIIHKAIGFIKHNRIELTNDQLSNVANVYTPYGKRELFLNMCKDELKIEVSNNMEDVMAPLKAFVSYSHKDDKLKIKLVEHLSLLQQEKVISTWSDADISAGIDLDTHIVAELETSQIILLLISASFMSSAYCIDTELKRAIERHKRNEARVIPIILKHCDWHTAPFGGLKALPKDGKPVSGGGWKNQDEAFADITKGIRKAATEILKTSI